MGWWKKFFNPSPPLFFPFPPLRHFTAMSDQQDRQHDLPELQQQNGHYFGDNFCSFFRSRPSSSKLHAMAWLMTSPHSTSALLTTHRPSLEQSGYMSYSTGIRNTFGTSLACLGAHLPSSSSPCKHSMSTHRAMFQLKSNSRSSFTPWSQGCLVLMSESVFSGQRAQSPSKYERHSYLSLTCF